MFSGAGQWIRVKSEFLEYKSIIGKTRRACGVYCEKQTVYCHPLFTK